MQTATGGARPAGQIVTSLGGGGAGAGVLLNMHCPAHNTQTHTETQNEENDKMLVTTSIASDRKDQCLFPKKMFL